MTGEPDRFTLEIQSGLYEGVRETLAEGRYRIGSEVGADIVLVEDGIAPVHLVIGLSGGLARFEPQADGVAVEGIGSLEAGTATEVPVPAAFSIGGTRIVLGSDRPHVAEPVPLPPPAPLLSRRPLVRALIGLQVAAVLVLMVVPNPVADALSPSDPKRATRDAANRAGAVDAAFPQEPAGGTPALYSRPASPLPQVERGGPARQLALVTPAAKRPVEPPPSTEAARALQEEVERAGLLNIAVEAGQGIVTAAGSVEPNAASRWQAVQQWFDGRFAGEITLVNGVSVKAEKVPVSLAIEAVWRGEPSHLIIRGQKYLEGAVLEGGWTIHRIEQERVVLEREGRLVAVRY